MVLLKIELDNLYAFENFNLLLSYPRKVKDSLIEEEHLLGFPNFRYSKVNVIMGANASGKSSLGYALMGIFNFIDRKQLNDITDTIGDGNRDAGFSLDYAEEDYLCRVECIIRKKNGFRYDIDNISVRVQTIKIRKSDSYETCIEQIDDNAPWSDNYIEELGKALELSWYFEYPDQNKVCVPRSEKLFQKVLKNTLMALDSSITSVEPIPGVSKSYVIRAKNYEVIIKDDEPIVSDKLSSGTKAGVGIASMITSILDDEHAFYYFDEKFTFIHSDMEKAFLSVIIEALKENTQAFFTTHNTDILDMALPRHSYIFLRKKRKENVNSIECVKASDYIKRNTDSLKNAVENDLFSAAPSTDPIFDLLDN